MANTTSNQHKKRLYHIHSAYENIIFQKAYNSAKYGQLLVTTSPLPNFKFFLQNIEALELFNEKVIKKQNKTGNNKMFFSVVLRKVILLFSEMAGLVQPDLFILERVS